MDRQAVFNKACEHLIKQNEQSLMDSGACAYRGKNGMKCVFGYFIEDVDYSENMEYKSVAAIIMKPVMDKLGVDYTQNESYSPREGKVVPVLVGDDISFLSLLQNVHDCYSVSEWKRLLRKLAHTFNLEIPDCILENAGEVY